MKAIQVTAKLLKFVPRWRYPGSSPGGAADAGRTDGARVLLDLQVSTSQRAAIEHR